MDGRLDEGVVRVRGDARQRFFDARGYGRPDGNDLALARVEAAHLLYRGDLDRVEDMGFQEFLADSVTATERFGPRFLVYADLRERGFYLTPAREGWPGYDHDPLPDFTVFERGVKPGGSVVHRVRVGGEREPLAARDLPGLTLAIVDEESDVSYFECRRAEFDGGTEYDPPARTTAELLDDRVICWDPPAGLYRSGFFGRPISGRDAGVVDALVLSLVEASYLADRGSLTIDRDGAEREPSAGGTETGTIDVIRERGRAVEGDRFDRRLAVYRQIREAGAVPKTGFKFGADFRVYDTVEEVESLPHSETLVRVIPPDHRFHPRELALDVRLAGGVRKRMVFTLAGQDSVESLSVGRLTP